VTVGRLVFAGARNVLLPSPIVVPVPDGADPSCWVARTVDPLAGTVKDAVIDRHTNRLVLAPNVTIKKSTSNSPISHKTRARLRRSSGATVMPDALNAFRMSMTSLLLSLRVKRVASRSPSSGRVGTGVS
jgi:hypothetical protein